MYQNFSSQRSDRILTRDAELLRRSVGCLCEVRSVETNAMVLLGRIRIYDGEILTIVSASGRELRPVIYNTEYKLVLHIPGIQAASWHGQICGSSRQIWMFDQVYCFHQEEQRDTFRQPLNRPAHVLDISDGYIPHFDKPKLAASKPCRIIDVSLGGLQIESAQMFRSGDRVMILNMTLSDGGEPFSFKATVRWVSPIEDGLARCGCSFESLSLRDENRLCAAILQIQRNDLAQQRT